MSIKKHLLSLYPPLVFSGIKIVKKSPDYRYFKVKLKLRFWTANLVGTQFGGSMFTMTDPFYMMMLIHNLGPAYTVWDKSAQIRYLKPGKSDLYAEFQIDEADLQSIREIVDEKGRLDWVKKVEIKDESGQVVAEVERCVNIKKKKDEQLH